MSHDPIARARIFGGAGAGIFGGGSVVLLAFTAFLATPGAAVAVTAPATGSTPAGTATAAPSK